MQRVKSTNLLSLKPSAIQPQLKCGKFTQHMIQSFSTATGYVVSDLHIFGASSLYLHHLDEVYRLATQHNVLVLNGDTFDFKRSKLQSRVETTREALLWLSALCSKAPDTTIYFIAGNHDCQPELLTGISSLRSAHANLHLHEVHVRIADALFIHGDILDAHNSRCSLEESRLRYAELEPSHASKVFGHLVTFLRLNSVEYLRNNKEKVVPQLAHSLKTLIPDELNGVRSIYFGHTHVPFRDFTFEGITYYNTGSLIRGLSWMPLEFPLA